MGLAGLVHAVSCELNTRSLRPLAGGPTPPCSRREVELDAGSNTDATAGCSSDFTHDPNANILTSLREDGSCWYYHYDGMQRLTKAEWKDGGTLLYGYQYNYDKVGNRVSMILDGETVCCYSYNACNELTDELGDQGEVDYAYDGRGNQVERKVLGGETLYFEYDSRSLITRIDSTEDGFTPNTFGYSALGQRMRKTDSTGTTYYVWDGLNITHEHDGSGVVTRRYTHGHTPIHGVFSLISVQDAQGCRYCYHMDQVGGIHRLTDAWGNIIKTYEFSPFGRGLEESGAAPNDFVFPGTYLLLPDLEGYPLSPTRPYDVGLGTFVSRDPVGYGAQEGNRYATLGDSPLLVVDPFGAVARAVGAQARRVHPWPPGKKELRLTIDEKPPRLVPTVRDMKDAEGRLTKSLALGLTTHAIKEEILFYCKALAGHNPPGRNRQELQLLGRFHFHIKSLMLNPNPGANEWLYDSVRRAQARSMYGFLASPYTRSLDLFVQHVREHETRRIEIWRGAFNEMAYIYRIAENHFEGECTACCEPLTRWLLAMQSLAVRRGEVRQFAFGVSEFRTAALPEWSGLQHLATEVFALAVGTPSVLSRFPHSLSFVVLWRSRWLQCMRNEGEHIPQRALAELDALSARF